jgi:hypothetical protein
LRRRSNGKLYIVNTSQTWAGDQLFWLSADLDMMVFWTELSGLGVGVQLPHLHLSSHPLPSSTDSYNQGIFERAVFYRRYDRNSYYDTDIIFFGI